MKGKFLFILMTSFSLFVLTACSENEVENKFSYGVLRRE